MVTSLCSLLYIYAFWWCLLLFTIMCKEHVAVYMELSCAMQVNIDTDIRVARYACLCGLSCNCVRVWMTMCVEWGIGCFEGEIFFFFVGIGLVLRYWWSDSIIFLLLLLRLSLSSAEGGGREACNQKGGLDLSLSTNCHCFPNCKIYFAHRSVKN